MAQPLRLTAQTFIQGACLLVVIFLILHFPSQRSDSSERVSRPGLGTNGERDSNRLPDDESAAREAAVRRQIMSSVPTPKIKLKLDPSSLLEPSDAEIDPFPARDEDIRTAVCLTGQARDFDLTGPSIFERLLPAYPNTHLFVHASLDEMAFKLNSFAWAPPNVTIAAVKIIPVWWMDEAQYPDGLIGNQYTPTYQQTLQQYRMVQGCMPLISNHEAKHGFRFNWIMRGRLDCFWKKPPPALRELDPFALTIPWGTDCSGLNDRLDVGMWHASRIAMSRLTLVWPVHDKDKTLQGLNAETMLRKEVEVMNGTVGRATFWTCVMTRHIYPTWGMPIFPLSSRLPLNGAYCRPCTPYLKGADAVKWLEKFHKGKHLPAPSGLPDGYDLCDRRTAWEDGWEAIYDGDEAVTPAMAEQRRRIMGASLAQCVALYKELQKRTEVWSTQPPLALCLRRYLGRSKEWGAFGESFNTLVPPKSLAGTRSVHAFVSSAVGAALPVSKTPSSISWAEALKNHTNIEAVYHEVGNANLCDDILQSGGHTQALFITQPEFNKLLGCWKEKSKGPSICQLLVGMPVQESSKSLKEKEKEQTQVRAEFSLQLEAFHFHLDSCIKEKGQGIERCTYFSTENCSPSK